MNITILIICHTQKRHIGETITMLLSFALLFSIIGFLNNTCNAQINDIKVDGKKKNMLNPKLCGAYPGLISNSSCLNSLIIRLTINNPIANIGSM